MADQSESKGSYVPVLVAIVTGIASVVSVYIANQKSNQNVVLKDAVTDSKQDLVILRQRYDSLGIAYNRLTSSYNDLVKRYKSINPEAPKEEQPVAVTPTLTPATSDDQDENIFPLPTIAQGSDYAHRLLIKKAVGDKMRRQVTIKFLSTNERQDGHENLYMSESIGTFQGTTYYAVRAKLGDKIGEGRDQYTQPGMQVVKGEPTSASIVMDEVSPTVSEFTKLIIHINGDRVPIKNVPISWQ